MHDVRPHAWASVTYYQASTAWPIFVKFGVGLLYRKMSSKHEFRENQRRKFRTFRIGVREIVFTREPLDHMIFIKYRTQR